MRLQEKDGSGTHHGGYNIVEATLLDEEKQLKHSNGLLFCLLRLGEELNDEVLMLTVRVLFLFLLSLFLSVGHDGSTG